MDLKEYLEKARITRKEFADTLKCSTTSLKNYIYGYRETPLSIAFEIEKVTKGIIKAKDMLELWEKSNGR
jgi:DNA-binding transcriptional regulator YdaS (Cro superfamily)